MLTDGWDFNRKTWQLKQKSLSELPNNYTERCSATCKLPTKTLAYGILYGNLQEYRNLSISLIFKHINLNYIFIIKLSSSNAILIIKLLQCERARFCLNITCTAPVKKHLFKRAVNPK